MDERTHSPRVAPRRHGGLRLGFFRAVEACAARCGGRAWYRRRHLAAGRFRVRTETVAFAGLRAGLEGFTIVQLSDLHAGPFLGPGDLADVVDAVAGLDPDVVAITGDFVTHHWSEVLRIRADCARLAARRGLFAVFGNHDYKDRLEHRIAAEIAPGIRVLRDECARIDTGDGVVALVGVEDLEEARTVDLDAARAGVRPGDVEIVLCHNPAGARAIAGARCAAILSGHTHGTQIDLPWLRRLGPAHPGRRVALGPTALVVSNGLGVVGAPLRFRSPAEIVVVRLRCAPGTGGAACTAASR